MQYFVVMPKFKKKKTYWIYNYSFFEGIFLKNS